MKKIILLISFMIFLPCNISAQVSRPPDRIYRNCSPTQRAQVIINGDGSISVSTCSGKDFLINGLPVSGISGSGTANTIPLWSSSSALTNSQLTQDANDIIFTGRNIRNSEAVSSPQNIFQITKNNFSPPGGGAMVQVITDISNASTYSGFSAFITRNTGAGNGQTVGGQFFVTNRSASVFQQYGVLAVTNNETIAATSVTFGGSFAAGNRTINGQANQLIGVQGFATNSNQGTVLDAIAGRFSFQNFAGGGTVTSAKGVSLSHWQVSAPTLFSYGIYADNSIDVGTTERYFIYSIATSDSFLSSNTRLANNKFFQGTNTTAGTINLIGVDNTNSIQIGNNALGSGGINLGSGAGYTGTVFIRNGGTNWLSVGSSGNTFFDVTNTATGIHFNPLVLRTNNIFLQGTTTGAAVRNLIGMDASNLIVAGNTSGNFQAQAGTAALVHLDSIGLIRIGDKDSVNNKTLITVDDPSASITVGDPLNLSSTTVLQSRLSGIKAVNNITTLGDFNVAGTGTRIAIDQANETIKLTSSNIPTQTVLINNNLGVVQGLPLSNGQVLIGATGGTPTASTLTAGNGVSITNAPASITIGADIASLDSQFTSVGNVGAGEDDLMTKTLSAGVLSADGQSLRVRVGGRFAPNVNLKQFRLYVNGTAIVTSGNLAFNNGTWVIDCEVMRRSPTTAISTCALAAQDSAVVTGGTGFSYVIQTNVTWANAIVIKMTGTGTANNDLTQEMMKIIFQK